MPKSQGIKYWMNDSINEDEDNVRSSLLFFRNLVTVEEKTKETDNCKLKKDSGCFPIVYGIQFECPDTDTCPESSK